MLECVWISLFFGFFFQLISASPSQGPTSIVNVPHRMVVSHRSSVRSIDWLIDRSLIDLFDYWCLTRYSSLFFQAPRRISSNFGATCTRTPITLSGPCFRVYAASTDPNPPRGHHPPLGAKTGSRPRLGQFKSVDPRMQGHASFGKKIIQKKNQKSFEKFVLLSSIYYCLLKMLHNSCR